MNDSLVRWGFLAVLVFAVYKIASKSLSISYTFGDVNNAVDVSLSMLTGDADSYGAALNKDKLGVGVSTGPRSNNQQVPK